MNPCYGAGARMIRRHCVPGHHPPRRIGGRLPLPTVIRQCTRTGCAESATATLTYQYRRAQVWLDDLHSERDPHAYDLCARHTERLSVPHGWQLQDRRQDVAVGLGAVLAGTHRLAG